MAEARARTDVLRDANGDGIPDVFKSVDHTAAQDFVDFSSGARGGLAKRFSVELPGKTVEEMEALLHKAGGTRDPVAPNTYRSVSEGQNTYPQACYIYPDGTLVRIKPLGDIKNGQQPMYSVEMQTKSLAVGGRPQNDVAFKMDSAGNPVPKGPDDINNPYTPRYPDQRKAYELEILRLGHYRLSSRFSGRQDRTDHAVEGGTMASTPFGEDAHMYTATQGNAATPTTSRSTEVRRAYYDATPEVARSGQHPCA